MLSLLSINSRLAFGHTYAMLGIIFMAPHPELNHAGGVYCVDAGKGIVHGEASFEMSYWLRRTERGYGFMTEAVNPLTC